MVTSTDGAIAPIRVAPGDLAFLLKECPRCFFDKYRHGVRRPSMFPKFFNVVDRAMKQRYADDGWHDIAHVVHLTESGLTPVQSCVRFRVAAQDGWVRSTTLPVRGAPICIRGAFDTVVEFEDGLHGVCDFKTTFPKHEHLWFYRRPLHAYAYACEHPAENRHNYTVPRLGLLVFNGNEFASNESMGGICGDLTWIELDRTDDLFMRFMQQAALLLERATPPAPKPHCAWCTYRGLNRNHAA